MDLGLEDKVAIITGGASGLGRCTAEYMRRDGVKIILADMNAELLEETAADLRSRGGEVGTTLVDVRDYDQCRAMVEHTLSTFGQADILVNSAGIGGPFQFFAESAPSDGVPLSKPVPETGTFINWARLRPVRPPGDESAPGEFVNASRRTA